MNRTPLPDFQRLRPLFRGQGTVDLDLERDLVEHRVLGHAPRTTTPSGCDMRSLLFEPVQCLVAAARL